MLLELGTIHAEAGDWQRAEPLLSEAREQAIACGDSDTEGQADSLLLQAPTQCAGPDDAAQYEWFDGAMQTVIGIGAFDLAYKASKIHPVKSAISTSRSWQVYIVFLALLVYAAAMVGFGRRAGLTEFAGNLLSWPSVSKWFIAYSALYFLGAVLLAHSIRPPATQAALRIRRGICDCGVLALAVGGSALYAVFDGLAFKLRA